MSTETLSGAPRVALVGCSALKSKTPAPAKAFYTSALFRAAYEYAEKTCDAVLIVSAFYGVVAPKTVLQPYDRNLREFRKSEREDWGARTIGELLPAFKKPQLVILTGEVYADALLYGAHWHNLPKPEDPLRRIRGCGARVAWLKANTPADHNDRCHQRERLEQMTKEELQRLIAEVKQTLETSGMSGGDVIEALGILFNNVGLPIKEPGEFEHSMTEAPKAKPERRNNRRKEKDDRADA
jgi:hypothetical protein